MYEKFMQVLVAAGEDGVVNLKK